MTVPDPESPGFYRPGHTFLHRLDARLKVLAVPLLVIAAFAAASPARLLLLTVAAGAAWLGAALPLALLGHAARFLRWLFLFTLVVHTVASPGRTLFGVAWLSADGFLFGLLTCWRLALALSFALLLSATTPPARLADGLAWFLTPLERLGVRVREGRDMVLLVLHFIPVFRIEAQAVSARLGGGRPNPGLLARARFAGRMLRPLLLRLVDRADALAHDLADGSPLPGTGTEEAAAIGGVRPLFAAGGTFLGFWLVYWYLP